LPLQKRREHTTIQEWLTALEAMMIASTLPNLSSLGIAQAFSRHARHKCYGQLAVVSDLDDGGFALNVDKELRGSAVL
jgi:hypothetical protein